MRRAVGIVFFISLSLSAIAAPLRISLPPLMGAVPVALGVAWGVFEEEGVEVELVPLASQRDRLVAFQAGQIDAMVTDLTSALMLAAQMPDDVAIVSTAYFPVEQTPSHLALITQAYSGLETLEDLGTPDSGHPRRIAVARQSDLEFALDELFHIHGLEPPVDAYIGQDDLLVNATWVLFGMVSAGVLPQPYVDYILNYDFEGKPELTVLSDFAEVPLPPSVIVFHRGVLMGRLGDVEAFYRGLEGAIDRLNASPREELVNTGWNVAVELFFPGLAPETLEPKAKARVEEALAGICIPFFPKPGPVPRDAFDKVSVWAEGKGYLTAQLSYEQVMATLGP